MAKIATRLFGDLGNQLFIYAAARRLALVNNAELVIDTINGFIQDQKYQLNYFSVLCPKVTESERQRPFGYARRRCFMRPSFERLR